MDDPILGTLIDLDMREAEPDFETARDRAKACARDVDRSAMLLSWHCRRTGQFGPPVRCGSDPRPPWIVWAASREADLTVSVNQGVYVFYFLTHTAV